MAERRRLIVGISGASGIVYGVRALELARTAGLETHLVVSRAAELTREQELGISRAELRALADACYAASDIGAAIASGSFKTAGMLIAPCSVKMLAEIATGLSTSLLGRAADVVLKERRRLVLLVRETPLSSIHLENMLTVTRAGAVVMPPVPAFYTKPTSIEDIVTQTVARALDLFDVEVEGSPRWGETIGPTAGGSELP